MRIVSSSRGFAARGRSNANSLREPVPRHSRVANAPVAFVRNNETAPREVNPPLGFQCVVALHTVSASSMSTSVFVVHTVSASLMSVSV